MLEDVEVVTQWKITPIYRPWYGPYHKSTIPTSEQIAANIGRYIRKSAIFYLDFLTIFSELYLIVSMRFIISPPTGKAVTWTVARFALRAHSALAVRDLPPFWRHMCLMNRQHNSLSLKHSTGLKNMEWPLQNLSANVRNRLQKEFFLEIDCGSTTVGYKYRWSYLGH